MAVNGRLIRRLRTDARLTVRQLADNAGVDYGYLSRVERGQATPTTRWLEDVAKALGVPVQSLTLPDNNGRRSA